MPLLTGTMFLNPSSGSKMRGAELAALESAAREKGLELIHIAPGVNVPQTIRRHMSEGRTLFIAAGGDGTINHVMQPLVAKDDAYLGILPVGTYNHFARDLGIPLEWREALEVATSGSSRQVDTARINDRFFVNNVSVGLYPELVAKREEHGRDYPRWKARIYAAVATLRKYPHATMVIESEHRQEVIRSHVFVVANNSYDLTRVGLESPRESLSSGRLAVYWAPHLSRFELLRYAARYLAGQMTSTAGFRSFQTTRLKVQARSRRLRIGVDGELFTMTLPLSITIVPASLLVRVPRESAE